MFRPILNSAKASKWSATIALVAILALGLAACGSDDDGSAGGESGGAPSKSIRIDGSSTVAPLTEAVAKRFMAENPDVRVTVGISGTGGGFEKFCAGETDVNDASRPIDADEVEACRKGGVGYEAFHVGTDAVLLLVNNELPVFCLSVEQLAAIWGPGSEIDNWSEVPGVDKETLGLEEEIDEELVLFGPGADSGTFDYFTEAINGKAGAIRKDYNDVGEDDDAIFEGVEGSPGSIGYSGLPYRAKDPSKARVIDVDNGEGCVLPTIETAQEGRYAPLTRPLFIYPSDEALQRPEVRAFVEYYLENVDSIAESVGLVPLTEKQLAKSRRAADKAGL